MPLRLPLPGGFRYNCYNTVLLGNTGLSFRIPGYAEYQYRYRVGWKSFQGASLEFAVNVAELQSLPCNGDTDGALTARSRNQRSGGTQPGAFTFNGMFRGNHTRCFLMFLPVSVR